MGTLPSKSLAVVIESMCARFSIKTFVETGTYRGETTRWAATRFNHVSSIEIDAATFEIACATLADLENVELHLGDSRTCLPDIVAEIYDPAAFWLDAHKGGGWFGKGDDCPILDEIDIINTCPAPTLIMIDDARGFLSPPPPPFDWQAWPDLRTILNRACESPARFSVVFDDVILCVPFIWREPLREELHRIKPKL